MKFVQNSMKIVEKSRVFHKFQQKYAYSPPLKYSGSVLDGRDITSIQMKNAVTRHHWP